MRRVALLGAALLAVSVSRETVRAQTPPAGTLIVSNMDAGTVWLVDLQSGEQRGVIPTLGAPHEVAVSSDGALAAVTNYGAPGAGNAIQLVDVASAEVRDVLTVEGRQRLHGAAFLPGDSLLVLTSEQTQELVVIGVADGVVRRAMPTGGGAPHMLALGGNWIYAANIAGGSVARIDPAARVETSTWPAGTTRTEGVAATPDGSEGWTGSMDAGTVVGIDGETGEVVARIEGLGVPYRLAVTPDGGTVVVSDPEREQVVLIDRDRGAVSAEVDVAAAALASGLGGAPSPQGFTLSPDGVWAFVSTKAVDRVAIVHLPSARVVDFVEAGDGPDGIGFSQVRVTR